MALAVAWATNKAKGSDPDLSIFVAFGSFDRTIDSDMVFSSSSCFHSPRWQYRLLRLSRPQ